MRRPRHRPRAHSVRSNLWSLMRPRAPSRSRAPMAERVTLVTGARKGLGRFLAEQRLARGDRVYGCSRQPSDLESPRYQHFCLDVSDEHAVRQMFSLIRKDARRLDHLVNNAGVASMNHALLTPMATVDAILRTNVAGTFLMCREGARI